MNRRDFLKTSALSGSSVLLLAPAATPAVTAAAGPIIETVTPAPPSRRLPALTPARWLWFPSERTLANTFVFFRRVLELPAAPRRATGWIAADSRYRLEVNGRRVQWGPAPADPRWAEADPLDLTPLLQAGANAIGALVLYYGHGDGTWPAGKPGFLFWLEIEHADGRKETLVSDAAWDCELATAWRPGHYKRWYLRALQEEFDARAFPAGWSRPDFRPAAPWRKAMALDCPADKPALCSNYTDYTLDLGRGPAEAELRARSIPMLHEHVVPVARLAESSWLAWSRSAEEYFDFRTPDAFRVTRESAATPKGPGEWEVTLDGRRAAVLTFEFTDQAVGWPQFTIEAPAGTVVELLVQEAHEIGGPALLNTHFDSWTRFTCGGGVQAFETFDFESCRWLQLHIRQATGRVRVRDVGLRRRVFPWPHPAQVRCSEPALQRLLDASVNTLHNCAQETLVDGMARERQQYSGDCGHQTHAIYLAFGETRLPARYLATFSQGLTLDGYFLDCWPAYDRLARLMERQLQLTSWGPILDHGVGFNFDCWHHYLYTGDRDAVREPYPRLVRFAQYLHGIRDRDGLLPVENLGIPSVWVDHEAYQHQRHKQCAFNLYAAAMLTHALAPLCDAFGDTSQAAAARALGTDLLAATVRQFWSRSRGLFVNNLPWLAEERGVRLCDRSLATAILFDQCPRRRTAPALDALAACPPEMGFSYPANAGWRLWALAQGGRIDAVLKDLRGRWAGMASVKYNNTLQEMWEVRPDSGQQWSHCPVAPLFVTYMNLAGIRPLSPGFKRAEIRPQLGDLSQLELTAFTVAGPIQFEAEGRLGDRRLTLDIPAGCEAELVVRREEMLRLERGSGPAPAGHLRYRLPAGRRTELKLQQL